jgi:hypothetical protein
MTSGAFRSLPNPNPNPVPPSRVAHHHPAATPLRSPYGVGQGRGTKRAGSQAETSSHQASAGAPGPPEVAPQQPGRSRRRLRVVRRMRAVLRVASAGIAMAASASPRAPEPTLTPPRPARRHCERLTERESDRVLRRPAPAEIGEGDQFGRTLSLPTRRLQETCRCRSCEHADLPVQCGNWLSASFACAA